MPASTTRAGGGRRAVAGPGRARGADGGPRWPRRIRPGGPRRAARTTPTCFTYVRLAAMRRREWCAAAARPRDNNGDGTRHIGRVGRKSGDARAGFFARPKMPGAQARAARYSSPCAGGAAGCNTRARDISGGGPGRPTTTIEQRRCGRTTGGCPSFEDARYWDAARRRSTRPVWKWQHDELGFFVPTSSDDRRATTTRSPPPPSRSASPKRWIRTTTATPRRRV